MTAPYGSYAIRTRIACKHESHDLGKKHRRGNRRWHPPSCCGAGSKLDASSIYNTNCIAIRIHQETDQYHTIPYHTIPPPFRNKQTTYSNHVWYRCFRWQIVLLHLGRLRNELLSRIWSRDSWVALSLFAHGFFFFSLVSSAIAITSIHLISNIVSIHRLLPNVCSHLHYYYSCSCVRAWPT